MRSVYPFRYDGLESITPRQFATYMLLVETALPAEEIGQKLGIGPDRVKQRQRELFDLLGVDSRLELMAQYHYRERHGVSNSA